MASTWLEIPSHPLTEQDQPMVNRRQIALGLAASAALLPAMPVLAQDTGSTSSRLKPLEPDAVLDQGHRFFGTVSRGLAGVVEEATSRWGRPNGYILGQEMSGAIVGGLRFGEGTLFTSNAGDYKSYWQGPSLGFDMGGDGARTMILIYNLRSVNSLYQRFGGMDGSAYMIGGVGMTALTAGDTIIAPIRSGLGIRLGVNIGYLKFTTAPTWNPF
jgi:hypothetical protein